MGKQNSVMKSRTGEKDSVRRLAIKEKK